MDSVERSDLVDSVIREMETRYVFPDLATKAGSRLRAALRAGNYDGFVDPVVLADRLTADLQDVTGDKHLRVRHSAAALEPPAPEDSSSITPEALAAWRQQAELRNFGIERVERLPCNVGLLVLSFFDVASVAGDAITAAMSLLAHTDALIVDLRDNRGGDPETVALACSYLFDERTHLSDIYIRTTGRTSQYWTRDWVPGKRFGQHKPVFVLTSPRTFSAAEEFSYDLQSLGRAIIVGQTTRGGAHPGAWRRVLPHFEVFAPIGRAINPVTNGNWEGTGVKPDVDVPEEEALRVAQILALKRLLDRTSQLGNAALAARITDLGGAGEVPTMRDVPEALRT